MRADTRLAAALWLCASWGCGADDLPETKAKAVAPTDPGARQALSTGLTAIINDASKRFAPLSYEYDEDLLSTIDKTEARLSGRAGAADAPRFLPNLDAAEEDAHFRETFRRWAARTGKDLRGEVDRLKAEVAARKPGSPSHSPESRQAFAAVFDDLVKLEVEEMRERRNRAIHEAAAPLLAKYRETEPALVRETEAVLDAPPYNLPAPAPSPGGGAPKP